jgi:hypothetical protein
MALERAGSKRPKWSLITSFWAAIAIILLVSVIAFFFLKKTIWVELEIVLGIVSLCMFGFLFVVLYCGVAFDRNQTFAFSWKGGEIKDWIDWASGVDTGGTFTASGSEAGPLGFLIGLLLDLVVSVVLVFLVALILWLGIGAMFTAIAAISVPLFFLFRRSIRFVVAKGRFCRGLIGKSVLFAFKATVTNTLWLYAIVVAGHYIARLNGD